MKASVKPLPLIKSASANYGPLLRRLSRQAQGLEPKQIGSFLRTHLDSCPGPLLLALSTAFGIDEGNDTKRMEITKKTVIPRLIKDPALFQEVMRHLPCFSAWTASGRHRLMPVALAVVNMFKNRNIFDRAGIAELLTADPSFRHLAEFHPFYANRFNVPAQFLPDLPNLTISPPKSRTNFQWLDIATAPKSHGSPTLNMLRKAFHHCLPGLDFEFHGTDISFPYYTITSQGQITPSPFRQKGVAGTRNERAKLGGIHYYDAGQRHYKALSDSFFADQRFDFVSVCMALHHLKISGERARRRPFSSLPLVDRYGKQINEQLQLKLPLSTQKVVDRILQRLTIGGLGFFTPFFPNITPHRQSYQHHLSDMFFIVKRVKENKYVFYDRHPIPFFPNFPEKSGFSPSTDKRFLSGPEKGEAGASALGEFVNPGIINLYPGKSQDYYDRVQRLLYRAELLAFRYQAWGKGIWERARKVAVAMRNRPKPSLPELFAIYLENVPGSHKKALLDHVKKLS